MSLSNVIVRVVKRADIITRAGLSGRWRLQLGAEELNLFEGRLA